MVGPCRNSGRQCNAEESNKREIVFQKKNGRSRMRWLDDVESDQNKMVIGW
jgi:hypothetical protein